MDIVGVDIITAQFYQVHKSYSPLPKLCPGENQVSQGKKAQDLNQIPFTK